MLQEGAPAVMGAVAQPSLAGGIGACRPWLGLPRGGSQLQRSLRPSLPHVNHAHYPAQQKTADADFDYVFNEKELNDILSFMSREDAGDLDSSSVPLSGALPSVPGALQFQPHAAPALLDDAGAPTCIGVTVGHQALGAGVGSQHLGFSMPTTNGAQAPLKEESALRGELGRREPSSGAAQQRHAKAHVQRSAGADGPDGKPAVSHSMVEKQRRDRINNLIDELRDLVPPQGCGPAGSDAALAGGPWIWFGDDFHASCFCRALAREDTQSPAAYVHPPSHTCAHTPRISTIWDPHHHLHHTSLPYARLLTHLDKVDSKRAKHVVLSDTIALVKELRDKVRWGQDGAQR